MRFRGPLADSYPAAVCLVVFALIPYLGLTSALTPLTQVMSKQIGLSPQAFQLTAGMANAAYALGTVISVQLAQHLPGRRMLLVYASLFVIGSVLAAWAPVPGLFIAGHVLQGMTTSLMLIAAVPPLVIGWPSSTVPRTAVVMNMCIFGAVAVGPVVGGVQAGAGDWKPMFWIVAGLGALALLFAVLTYEDQPPQDTSAPWDWAAILLAGLGCAAAFFGASELSTHPFLSLICFMPLVSGAILLATLVVYQFLSHNPLMPVRQLVTTFPVAGIIVAVTAGAASVSVIELAQTALQKQPRPSSPVHIAMLFWPEFGGAIITAVLFGLVFRTRLIPVFVIAGMMILGGGAAILTRVATGPHVLVVVGSGLIGLGVGASVSPALFIAGLSMRSAQIQRVFALVELLRGVAAFMIAPILMHLTMTVAQSPTQGLPVAMWICVGLAVGGGGLAAYVMALGRARPQRPDLDAWLDGEPAWDSPELLAGIRGETTAPAVALSAVPDRDGAGNRARRSGSLAR
jgi:MFS family permease